MKAVDFDRAQEPTYCRTIQPFQPQESRIRIDFSMKDEHAIDKPAAGRATQIAAMVITILLAVIWVYFWNTISTSQSRRMEGCQSGARIPALYHPSDWPDPHSWRPGPSNSQHASIDGVGLCWSHHRSFPGVLFTPEQQWQSLGQTRSDSRPGACPCFVCIKTLHARKPVVDMTNTLGRSIS